MKTKPKARSNQNVTDRYFIGDKIIKRNIFGLHLSTPMLSISYSILISNITFYSIIFAIFVN